MKIKTALKIIFFLFLSGCGPVRIVTVPVNVYNLGTGEVIHGEFYWTGVKGQAGLKKDDGTICPGEYLTEIGGSSSVSRASSWGSIYSWGAGYLINSSTSVRSSSRPNTQIGSAILVCPDKNIIECEYIVNVDNHGSGFCRDNKKTKYKIMW